MLTFLIIVLGALISALHLRTLIMKDEKHHEQLQNEQLEQNGDHTWGISSIWNYLMAQYGVPLAHYFVSVTYSVYVRLTLMNVSIFILKYVPTLLYMYKFIKDMYDTSRERIKRKQIEMEDIQLQIQIVNTKLCVRDAEFSDRAEQLRRGAERLRRVRARVRGVIAGDDALRRALQSAAWDGDHDATVGSAPDEEGHSSHTYHDCEFIVELLKELKYEHLAIPEMQSEKMEYADLSRTDPNTPENSVYSSASDVDLKTDCRVKIVKVTNVYKLAYLKHYIKQKRLRRANKQALLKKKMEGIKKLLEDWQKTLNMVISSKLTILNIDPHPIDVASQDAMGDYSKPHESSDTDSDFRNSCTDLRYDEYSLSWAQNPYKPYSYNYEDVSEPNREIFDTQDFGDVRYPTQPMFPCDRKKTSNMVSIVEETNSQIAIEEIKSDSGDDYECRDLVIL